MPDFALNQMTVARLPFEALVTLAADLGCVGVELRNDLGSPLFDGADPALAGRRIRAIGLRLLALAEVKAFNAWSKQTACEAERLIALAAQSGAEAVVLIPRNDGQDTEPGIRKANLRRALTGLMPMLDEWNIVGLIEPLGFQECSLRHKEDVVEVIEDLGLTGKIRLVHDTFHHALANGGEIFAEHTGIVHISGVTDETIQPHSLADRHRGLVNAGDRLGNIEQIRRLQDAGYVGAFSFEAFSPDVHAIANPKTALLQSIRFIETQVAGMAA